MWVVQRRPKGDNKSNRKPRQDCECLLGVFWSGFGANYWWQGKFCRPSQIVSVLPWAHIFYRQQWLQHYPSHIIFLLHDSVNLATEQCLAKDLLPTFSSFPRVGPNCRLCCVAIFSWNMLLPVINPISSWIFWWIFKSIFTPIAMTKLVTWGLPKTIDNIHHSYYWLGFKKDMVAYVASCDACKCCKIPFRSPSLVFWSPSLTLTQLKNGDLTLVFLFPYPLWNQYHMTVDYATQFCIAQAYAIPLSRQLCCF